MGHRIPHHEGKCKYPHGHRYRLEVTISGNVCQASGHPSQGMVIDFSEFKTVLKESIYDMLDHRFIVYEKDTVLKNIFSGPMADELKILFVPFIPTSENIASWCFDQLKNQFSKNVQIKRCRLYETPNNWVDYYGPQE